MGRGRRARPRMGAVRKRQANPDPRLVRPRRPARGHRHPHRPRSAQVVGDPLRDNRPAPLPPRHRRRLPGRVPLRRLRAPPRPRTAPTASRRAGTRIRLPPRGPPLASGRERAPSPPAPARRPRPARPGGRRRRLPRPRAGLHRVGRPALRPRPPGDQHDGARPRGDPRPPPGRRRRTRLDAPGGEPARRRRRGGRPRRRPIRRREGTRPGHRRRPVELRTPRRHPRRS